MKKRLRIVLLAFLVAAIAVPVGFALSLESAQRANERGGVEPVARVITRPFISAESAPSVTLTQLPEGAKLVGVGSVLFVLAAVMRRTRRDT